MNKEFHIKDYSDIENKKIILYILLEKYPNNYLNQLNNIKKINEATIILDDFKKYIYDLTNLNTYKSIFLELLKLNESTNNNYEDEDGIILNIYLKYSLNYLFETINNVTNLKKQRTTKFGIHPIKTSETIIDYLNYISINSNYNRQFTLIELYNLYTLNLYKNEMLKLKNFLTMVEIDYDRLIRGINIDKLLEKINFNNDKMRIIPKEEALDALAYAYEKVINDNHKIEKTTNVDIHSRIKKMKTN